MTKCQIFNLRSLLCYKFQCSRCNATYYGKTKCHYKARTSEHTGKYGKSIKSTRKFVRWDHMLVCDNIVSSEDFSLKSFNQS